MSGRRIWRPSEEPLSLYVHVLFCRHACWYCGCTRITCSATICGLPRQTPERFHTTLELVGDLRPERISLFSFAYLPEQLPLQRKIAADDLPSQRECLAMLDDASQLLGAAGYEAIGMDHYALAGDSLAIAAREGRLHRNFQGYTTGGELDLLGVGPLRWTGFSGQVPSLTSEAGHCS